MQVSPCCRDGSCAASVAGWGSTTAPGVGAMPAAPSAPRASGREVVLRRAASASAGRWSAGFSSGRPRPAPKLRSGRQPAWPGAPMQASATGSRRLNAAAAGPGPRSAGSTRQGSRLPLRTRSSGKGRGRPNGAVGVSRLDGSEDVWRGFPEPGTSKSAPAEIPGRSRPTPRHVPGARGPGARGPGPRSACRHEPGSCPLLTSPTSEPPLRSGHDPACRGPVRGRPLPRSEAFGARATDASPRSRPRSRPARTGRPPPGAGDR